MASIGTEGRSTDAEGDEDVEQNFCSPICTGRLDSGSFIDAMLSRVRSGGAGLAGTPRKHVTRTLTHAFAAILQETPCLHARRESMAHGARLSQV